MFNSLKRLDSEFHFRIKILMLSRVIFCTLLLGSTAFIQFKQTKSFLDPALIILYGLILLIYVLSFIYAVIFKSIRSETNTIFAFTQIIIDTFFVSLIIFLTGSFLSFFSFLYLVVIIYASILLSGKKSLIIAGICCIQYSLLILLDFNSFEFPISINGNLFTKNNITGRVLYNLIITMSGCFAVAFLSNFLNEQTRRTKRELIAMEDHVKRYEKLAAVGEMAAGLAHEIKNPLASLAGSIQLLRDDLPYDPQNDKLMQIILREADRLSGLVNNFLLFARPPTARIQPVYLQKILSETVELFEKGKNQSNQITIEQSYDNDCWIEIDPFHLKQVFWNLLLNAAESIVEQGAIQISTERLKHNIICIKISDNGCGMTQETVSHIFDPFFTTKTKGSGLGLSIVHSILKTYDCQLNIESAQKSGTTFSLIFKGIRSPE